MMMMMMMMMLPLSRHCNSEVRDRQTATSLAGSSPCCWLVKDSLLPPHTRHQPRGVRTISGFLPVIRKGLQITGRNGLVQKCPDYRSFRTEKSTNTKTLVAWLQTATAFEKNLSVRSDSFNRTTKLWNPWKCVKYMYIMTVWGLDRTWFQHV